MHKFSRGQRFAGLFMIASALGAAAPGGSIPQPMMAPAGVTAISGMVLDQAGNPLPGVELLSGASHTRSGIDGKFLIAPAVSGKTVVQIDGRHAGAAHLQDYGFYEVRVDARPGQTTVLPFKSSLPLIDHTNDMTIASPTLTAVIVKSASVPGLELHIPAGVVIKDVDGKPVTRIGITTMPKDRTPFPLPLDFDLPVFYTIQPGAACLFTASLGVGTAQVYYPNSLKALPKARATFFRYEPDGNGWVAHGTGTVNADGNQIVPDDDTYITDFGSAECDSKTRTRQKPLHRPDPRMLRRLAQ